MMKPTPHTVKKTPSESGFTLLEMMIAIAILAVLFSMVYSAINSAVNARAANQEASERLVNIHRGLSIIEQDAQNIIARFSQFPNELWSASLEYFNTQEGEVLSFSRHGWPITLNQNASDLARVSYDLQVEERQTGKTTTYKLYRVYWRNIDSLTKEPTRRRVILRGIKSVQFKFLDENLNWVQTWPNEEAALNAAASSTIDVDSGVESDVALFRRLPRAFEMILDMQGFGKIRRVFILSEAHGV